MKKRELRLLPLEWLRPGKLMSFFWSARRQSCPWIVCDRSSTWRPQTGRNIHRIANGAVAPWRLLGPGAAAVCAPLARNRWLINYSARVGNYSATPPLGVNWSASCWPERECFGGTASMCFRCAVHSQYRPLRGNMRRTVFAFFTVHGYTLEPEPRGAVWGLERSPAYPLWEVAGTPFGGWGPSNGAHQPSEGWSGWAPDKTLADFSDHLSASAWPLSHRQLPLPHTHAPTRTHRQAHVASASCATTSAGLIVHSSSHRYPRCHHHEHHQQHQQHHHHPSSSSSSASSPRQ